MKKEKILFVDDLNRQWSVGKYENIATTVKEPISYYVVELPCVGYSMYPETNITDDDLQFCRCLLCLSSLEKGNICLIVKDDLWSIGLKCGQCTELSQNVCKIYITHILGIIQPIITKGSEIINNQCLVCERPKCKDNDCIDSLAILYTDDVEKLFEHFYLINLNIFRPLLGKKFKDPSIWRTYSKCFLQK